MAVSFRLLAVPYRTFLKDWDCVVFVPARKSLWFHVRCVSSSQSSLRSLDWVLSSFLEPALNATTKYKSIWRLLSLLLTIISTYRGLYIPLWIFHPYWSTSRWNSWRQLGQIQTEVTVHILRRKMFLDQQNLKSGNLSGVCRACTSAEEKSAWFPWTGFPWGRFFQTEDKGNCT